MAGALSATDGAPKPLMPMVYACLGISMCAAIFYEEYNVAVFALTIFCLETQGYKLLMVAFFTIVWSILTDIISHSIMGKKILENDVEKDAGLTSQIDDLGRFCVLCSILVTLIKPVMLCFMFTEFKRRGGNCG